MSKYKYIKIKVMFHDDDLAALSWKHNGDLTQKDLESFILNAVESSMMDVREQYEYANDTSE